MFYEHVNQNFDSYGESKKNEEGELIMSEEGEILIEESRTETELN